MARRYADVTIIFLKLVERACKTRDAIIRPIEDLFSKNKPIDEETLEELEAVLIQSDLGIAATSAIIESLRECGSRGERLDADGAVALIEQELISILVHNRASCKGRPTSYRGHGSGSKRNRQDHIDRKDRIYARA